jgi:hypothetical protein
MAETTLNGDADQRSGSGAYSTAMADDGDTALPQNGAGDDGDEDEKAREDLDEAHEHADPSKGDKKVDGSDRLSTDGDEPAGAADEEATKFKRSMMHPRGRGADRPFTFGDTPPC